MSNALSHAGHLPLYDNPSLAKTASTVFAEVVSANTHAYERLKERVEDKLHKDWRQHYILLGAIAIALHSAVFYAYIHRDTTPIIKPPKQEVQIEFIKPVIEPPPKVEPPPPPPPPPQVKRATPPPPVQQPTPALRTSPAETNIAPDTLTVQENTTAPKSTGPVVAASEPTPPPAPPAPKVVEEPITEATGNAAYLKNPQPDYPPEAERRGWEGKVLLRVRVLASGQPESVEVKQSSGKKILDDAAIAAVKKWTFVPSKRGSTPIDGWATVPMVFKLQ